ncbi:hypothetical protein [Pseudomonas aeruginosa]|uniref:hypothetical protein n=1 Tax=Pseudomonas aeruginosa TaxID=287 RepID=UPI00071B1B3E|nr:hypothetical protein [Pseudomonas aeruginosa]KSG19089.1 hypothetical protein AO948_20905 [Pseudomonas aeruginosa]
MTQLYRHFNAHGELLYVGISKSTFDRYMQHKYGSKWSEEIRSMTIEYFPSRAEAEDAERRAIIAEKPLWNVTHNQPEKPQETQKSATPKKIKAKSRFDIDEAVAGINFTAQSMEKIYQAATGALQIMPDGYFHITTKTPMTSTELGLVELFERGRFKLTSGGINMCTGIRKSEAKVIEHEVTLISPALLRRHLLNDGSMKPYLAQLIPALDRYTRAYDGLTA